MLQFDELRLEFEGLKPQLKELALALKLDSAEKEIAALEEESAKPDFWDDPESAQITQQKIGDLKNTVETFGKLSESFDDVLTMIELAVEDSDESMLEEITSLANSAKKNLEMQTLSTLLSGEYDSKNARVALRRWTGWKCCTECTANGRSGTISSTSFWIF
jgi:peptide chain release factor 2